MSLKFVRWFVLSSDAYFWLCHRIHLFHFVVMCPKGDDPMTLNQNYKQIMLVVESPNGAVSGSLGIVYGGFTSLISLSSPSSTNCQTALESSPMIDSVACHFHEITSHELTYNITFLSFPTFPKENNLHTNDGNPPPTDFYCDVSQAAPSGIRCFFTDVVATNVRGEYDPVWNR